MSYSKVNLLSIFIKIVIVDRLSCRSCPGNASFSATTLRPCDWRTGKILNNLQEFSCSYTVDIRY